MDLQTRILRELRAPDGQGRRSHRSRSSHHRPIRRRTRCLLSRPCRRSPNPSLPSHYLPSHSLLGHSPTRRFRSRCCSRSHCCRSRRSSSLAAPSRATRTRSCPRRSRGHHRRRLLQGRRTRCCSNRRSSSRRLSRVHPHRPHRRAARPPRRPSLPLPGRRTRSPPRRRRGCRAPGRRGHMQQAARPRPPPRPALALPSHGGLCARLQDKSRGALHREDDRCTGFSGPAHLCGQNGRTGGNQPMTRTFSACRPFGPCLTSNSTF